LENSISNEYLLQEKKPNISSIITGWLKAVKKTDITIEDLEDKAIAFSASWKRITYN